MNRHEASQVRTTGEHIADHTLEEVGQQFSVTRERIRQIEAREEQEYLRLALAAAAILIGLSVAYHYVVYIPERDRAEKLNALDKSMTESRDAQAKQAAAEKAALERRNNYRICLSNAQANYSARWDSTCRSRSIEADKKRAQCIENGGAEEYCRNYSPPLPSADCSLPDGTSDDYDAMLKEEKQRCLDEAKSDVLETL